MLRRPSAGELVALSAPTFAFAAFEVTQTVLLPVFLTSHIGLGVTLAGTLLMVARLCDIAMDIVCGTVSDLNWLPAIGRRRAWMLLGLPVALLGCSLLYRLAPGSSWSTAGLLILVASGGWTLINASHGAWALEAATELTGRSRVFAGRGLAGLAGYFVLTAMLSFTDESASSQMTVALIFLWIAGPVTLAILLQMIPDRGVTVRSARVPHLRAAWWATIASPRRRRLWVLFALVGAHSAVVGGSYVFLVGFGLRLPQLTMPGLLCQACFTGLGLLLSAHYVSALGARTLLLLVFGIKALVAAAIPLLPIGSGTVFFVWVAVSGLVSGVDFMLLRALAGRELDLEGADSGHAPAGVFYAAFHAPFNIAGALLTGLMFWLLGEMGFSALNPELGRDAIRWVPALLALVLAALAYAATAGLPAKDGPAEP